MAQGPGFGTNFTLACPYTLLAHYHELDWAASCGVEGADMAGETCCTAAMRGVTSSATQKSLDLSHSPDATAAKAP